MSRLSLLALSCVGLAGTAHAAHPVFDLVANRTLAHAQRQGGLAIAAGTPGFARYVHFSRPLATWRLRQSEEGKRVALAQAQALLEVPLTAAQAQAATVTLRLKSPVRQTLKLAAHGQHAAVTLTPGWQTVTATLPKGALVDGENSIALTFSEVGMFGDRRAAAAVEWIDIGAAGVATAPPLVYEPRGLALPKGGGLAYFVQVPEAGALLATIDGGGCTVHASVRAKEGAAIERELGSGAALDLAALAGKVVRLQLSADGEACQGAYLRSAALLADGDAVTVKRVPPPRNVIFWLTDDTRSDKFKLYSPKSRVETPVFDELAKRSTLFKVAYVQGNESRVGHASLWTGLYPLTHRFISDKAKLDPKFNTLPEVMKAAGRATFGLMGNGFIDAFWGFGEGWDLLRNHIHEGGGLRAEDFVAEAKRLLGQRGSRPYFLYLGTIDAHVSWRAHKPWIDQYDPEPYHGPFVKACLDPQLEKVVGGTLAITDRDKRRVVALYDSDVSYNDRELGKLLKLVDLEQTMIIFTSDHGEELWDHGKVGHGQSLREELVHVPLLISYPPLFPPGREVKEGVEIIDLLPTLAEALGEKAPPEAQGQSLIGLAQGEGAGYPRPAIGSQYELAHTMRLGRWKLWVGGSGETHLYDAAADAGETHELSALRPLERRFVTDALGLWSAYQGQWKKSRWGVASNHTAELARDLELVAVGRAELAAGRGHRAK